MPSSKTKNRVLNAEGWHLGAVHAKLAPTGDVKDICGLATAIEFSLWAQRASPFWVGDLLVRAEELFGDKIYDMLDGADWSVERIDMWVGVARKVPPSVRRSELSWSHHAAVASCPVPWQRTLLAEAVSGSLTSVDLRKLVASRRHEWKSGVGRVAGD